MAGLDVHEPRKWVPLEKVLYVGRLINSTRLNAVLCSSWERVRASNAQLMLFNGIWSAVLGLQGQILELAKKKHVLLADGTMPEPSRVAALANAPVTVVTLISTSDSGQFIRLKVESL